MRVLSIVGLLATVLLATGLMAAAAEPKTKPSSGATPGAEAIEYTADGRMSLAQMLDRFATLERERGWRRDDVFVYPDDPTLRISSWRTSQEGPALWLIAGIHGEEPAGPNALARELPVLAELARHGVPVVVIPLANPRAYRHNWRYPNTPERDWRAGGGYSVGDSEYLLPDLDSATRPRAAQAPGPETLALTQFVLRAARSHPPRLVIDLHEDELSREGGYIYSQGARADGNPIGAEIVRLLQDAGIPLRTSGQTRFGEPIVAGVISRDDRGGPIRDGSIDELLAAREIFVDGQRQPGPGAETVIVVETPAFAGSQFERRVDAHAAVIRNLPRLWALSRPAD